MSRKPLIYSFLLLCLFLSGCGAASASTQAAVPTVTPIAGWHALQGPDFQIWLPESYVGGTDTNLTLIASQLDQVGPAFAAVPRSLQQSGTPFTAFAVDTQTGDTGKVTYMLVGKEKLSSSMDMSSYIDQLANNLLGKYSEYKVLQKEVVASTRYPTGRLVAEVNTPQSADVDQVMYTLQSGNVIWQFAFTTPVDEYEKRARTFEQIADSVSLPASAVSSPAAADNFWVLVVIGVVAAAFIVLVWIWSRRREYTRSSSAKKRPLPKKRKR